MCHGVGPSLHCHMVQSTQEVTSACLSHSLASRKECSTECQPTLTAPFKTFRTNCCCCVVMKLEKGDVCVDEVPKYVKERKLLSQRVLFNL